MVFVAHFVIDAGTAVGFLLLVLIVVTTKKGFVIGNEPFDVEMVAMKSWNEYEETKEEETRMVQQMESTRAMETGVSHLLSEHLDKIDRDKPFL